MYPPVEPFDAGLLDVGDGERVYYEVCGDPSGKPAVVLHGGPGSGCTPNMRRYFDPSRYRIVLLDQRGCGRSTPHAASAVVSLANNTTHHLVDDLERLRQHLRIDRWLVFGVSWGSTLALTYAERRPERVSAMVLASVVTTTRREIRWVTREVGRYFPEQWEQFRQGVPAADRDGDLVASYYRLLHDPEEEVRKAAAREWCQWEDSHAATSAGHKQDARYSNPSFRMAFARLVTHYWHHAAWLQDGTLLENAGRLDGIRGVLIHGRLDLSSPIDIPWRLAQAWPSSELVVVEGAGHGTSESATQLAVLAATDRFADRP